MSFSGFTAKKIEIRFWPAARVIAVGADGANVSVALNLRIFDSVLSTGSALVPIETARTK
ncbi:MAG: hypothetical protein IPG67_18325 [Acidobacteria bacterium]|nr:hypothetical protein [Acidobacteriota bacterium]